MTRKIAILASGGGSNAQKIIEHFDQSTIGEVVLLAANKSQCGALDIAEKAGIEKFVINKENFQASDEFLRKLLEIETDLVVLAGFLWLIPAHIVEAFQGRIVNIHPALLPKFGGKGMYGMNVHRAVKEAGETRSGMSIHFVNEYYDEGDIIFQKSVELNSDDSPENIASKVLQLEHAHYPSVIEQVLLDQAKA